MLKIPQNGDKHCFLQGYSKFKKFRVKKRCLLFGGKVCFRPLRARENIYILLPLRAKLRRLSDAKPKGLPRDSLVATLIAWQMSMGLKEILKDKKRKAAFISGLSFIVLSASLAIPSFAWFAKVRNTSKLDGLSGAAHGSYFSGGDGSKNNPFIIDKPKQLYYFNWLQDLGYFNMPNDDKTGINQTYFKLDADLDMTGYVLPPAGTKEYPFVGNFNGNGHAIQKLMISNDESALNDADPPKGATYSNGILKQAEIVGFFGVVGSLTNEDKVNGYTFSSEANQIDNLAFEELDVVSSAPSTLAGLAVGYVNGKITKVGVKDSSISVKEGAQPITGVAGVTHLSEYSLVGYATEDYRAKTDVSDETISMPQIDNPNTDHGSTNWGGSVNMKQMYNDLKSEMKNSNISKDAYYVSSETVDVSPDGTEGEPYNIVYGTGDRYHQDEDSTPYYYRNGTRNDADGNAIASYGLAYRNLNSDQYVYVYGAHKDESSNLKKSVTRNIYANYSLIGKNGNYLTGSATASRAGVVGNTTDVSKAGKWRLPSDGTSGSVGIDLTYASGTGGSTDTFYLSRSSDGSLVIDRPSGTSGNPTQWTYDSEKGNLYTISNGRAYVLDFVDSAWTLVDSSVSDSSFLTIFDTASNTYAGYSGTAETQPTSASSYVSTNYRWGYSANAGYYPVSNSSAFLGVKSTNWTQTAYVTSKNGPSGDSTYGRFTLQNVSSDGTGTGNLWISSFDGGTSYLVYNASQGEFQVSYNTNSGQNSNLPNQRDTFVVRSLQETAHKAGLEFTPSSSTYEASTETVTRNATATVNSTYLPLAFSYDDEKSKTGINGVSSMNTGYFVGGDNYVNGDDRAGDARFSEYYKINQLYTAFGYSTRRTNYSSSRLQVLTRSTAKKADGSYTDRGWTKIKDQYNKNSSVSISGFNSNVDSETLSRYDSARRNLQYTIWNTYDNATASSSTTLYGVHFMNAAISTQNTTKVGKAVVYDAAAEARYQAALKEYLKDETGEKPVQEGSVYYDYEVPEDSINFNLATEGYVTFFGATYYVNSSYGSNKSFFSLHEIDRNEDNSIKEIREIKKIYANLGSNRSEQPYVYSYDGNLPANTDENHLVFDTSWISTNVQMVNYCLYYFEIPVNAGEYALGSVSGLNGSYLLYLDIGTGAADYQSVTIEEKVTSKTFSATYPTGVDFIRDVKNVSEVTGGATAALMIIATPNDKIKYAVSASGSGTSLVCSSPSSLEIAYQDSSTTVSGSAGEAIKSIADSPRIATMERKTIQTFSPSNLTLSLAYSCTWTIENAKKGDSLQLYFPGQNASWSVESGSASISNGLVSFSSDGQVIVKADGTGSKAATEDWEGPASIKETTPSIFSQFKMEILHSSATVEYEYEELEKTYKVTIHCPIAFSVNVLSLPKDSTYKIQINGTDISAVGSYNFTANN